MNKIEEFKKIFVKVNGFDKLKHYAKTRVLLFSLFQTASQGFDKKSLEIVRLSVDNKIYKRLKNKYKNYINKYISDNESVSLEHNHPNIIWTSWLQGEDEAPHIVKKCINSMRDNIKDREIIVITEDNYSNYIQFPNYIIDKYKRGIISKVQFSDLMRIELISKYGGTWLDATVYVTNILKRHSFYLDSDLFLFQTLKPGLDGLCSSISSWLITASSNQRIILLVRSLLHDYWKNNDYAVDYFILHYFFQMALEAYSEDWMNVVPVSNEMPHVLLLRLFEKYNETIWKCVKDITPFHKLSYRLNFNENNVNDTYYDVIIKQ